MFTSDMSNPVVKVNSNICAAILPAAYIFVPSLLKISAVGPGSVSPTSYLAENVGAAKEFAFTNNDKKINAVSLTRYFNNFITYQTIVLINVFNTLIYIFSEEL